MQKISPFLWFDDQAEQAVNFYTSIFKNARVTSVSRVGDGSPGGLGQVMMVSFQLAGQDFTALNGGPEFSFTPATSFFVSCQSQEELYALWEKFCDGGTILMELETYPFSEKFGWIQDRYGVSWQLTLAGVPQKITPYLLFVGDKHGKAEAAINQYIALFENSSITQIERYKPGETEPEGTVKHARFTLNGQEFMAMDSAMEHQFTFTEAISFFVNCEDQAEVDRLWNKLSEGGEKSQCGWLTDRFGVTWQIIPTILGELMNDPDPERAQRVTQAMLKMNKIDIAQLKQAYEQA